MNRVTEARAAAYARACVTPSDINEHLPYLYQLARECQHVTELGRGHGNSAIAFIHAQPRKFVSYDVNPLPEDSLLQSLAGQCEVQLLTGDSCQIEIEETDLLFIDTLHTFEQMAAELNLHGMQARKYIVCHDSVTFGDVGCVPGTRGIRPAIDQWLVGKPFQVSASLSNNNGLLILKRQE